MLFPRMMLANGPEGAFGTSIPSHVATQAGAAASADAAEQTVAEQPRGEHL